MRGKENMQHTDKKHEQEVGDPTLHLVTLIETTDLPSSASTHPPEHIHTYTLTYVILTGTMCVL